MKNLLSLLAAAILCGMAMLPLSAASAANGYVAVELSNGRAVLCDEDGAVKAESTAASADAGSYAFEVGPGQDLYLNLGEISSADTSALYDLSEGRVNTSVTAAAAELADDDLFKLKTERDGGGGKLVKVSQYNEKALGGPRSAWVKLAVSDSQTPDDLKAVLDLTFTAKRDDGAWEQGDYATLRIILWINNETVPGDDAEQAPGDKFVYKPVNNEQNAVEWDDVATLAFTADDDASKFYAKLSTKVDEAVFQKYGAPADADLFFRDFTGAPAISSTSRATLTLLYPWTGQEGYRPDPAACHIYTVGADGSLSDITGLFTYLATDENGGDVDGWRMRTRTLCSYVISDKPLELAPAGEPQSPTRAAPPVSRRTWEEAGFSILHNTKPVPNTGL